MAGLDFEALGGKALTAPKSAPKGLNFEELGGKEIAAEPPQEAPAGLDFESLGGKAIDDQPEQSLGSKALEIARKPTIPIRDLGGRMLDYIAQFEGAGDRGVIRSNLPKTFGTLKGVAELAEGMTTPENAALLLAASKIPFETARKVISGGFGALMAKELPTLHKEYTRALSEGNQEEAARMATLMIGTGVMALGGFKHALGAEEVTPIRRRAMTPEEQQIFKEAPAQEPALQEAAATLRELGAPDPTSNFKDVPGKTKPVLSPAEAREVNFVQKNYEPVRETYKAAAEKEVGTPRYLSSDLFKTMDAPGREPFRGELSSVRRPAGREFIERYKQELLNDPQLKDKPIMIMAGITGAGKTTSLRSLGELGPEKANEYALILDTNLANFEAARATVKEFLDSSPNREVRINYIERDPVGAYTGGVMPRSITEKRVVPIDEHVGFMKAKDSIIKLQEEFKDDPRVAFRYLENNGAKGEARPISLADLKKIKYNESEVRRSLYEHVQREEAAGRLEPAQGQLLRGDAEQGTLRSNRPGDVSRGLQRQTQEGQSAQEVTPEPESFGAPSSPNFVSTHQRIPVDPIVGVAPKSLDKIIFDASKGAGRKVFYGQPSKNAGGTYYPGTSATVVKYAGDLDITAHELAHSLDDRFQILTSFNRPGVISAFDGELSQFWPYGSVKSSGPKSSLSYKRAEGVAEFIRAWVVNPRMAEQQAPKFTAYLKSKLPPEILQSIKTFSDDVRSFAGATAHEKIMANVNWRPPDNSFLRSVAGDNVGPGFRLTWADRLQAHLQDDLKAFTKAAEYARGEKGIEKLLPENDPEVLARLYSGIHAKMDDIFERGMVDTRNQRVTPGGIKWLFETLDNSSLGTLEKDIQQTASYMIAQRTIERVEKPLSRAKDKLDMATAARAAKLSENAQAEIAKLNEILDKRKVGLDKDRAAGIKALKEKTQASIKSIEKAYEKKYEEMLKERKGPIGREQLNELATIERAYQGHREAIARLGKEFDQKAQEIENLRGTRRIEILKKVSKAKAQIQAQSFVAKKNLAEYFKSRRLSGVGGGINRDYDVSAARLAQLQESPRYQNIVEAANRYRQWADATLRYMVNKGRLSEKQYEAIKANNEYYVAMQRFMETAPNEEMVVGGGRSGGRLGSSAQPIKTFKGSSRAIENPYTSLMDSTYKAIREADRNEVLQAFTEILSSHRGMGQGKVQDLASVGREASPTDRNTIPIFINGEKKAWQFQDDVYKSLKGLVEGHYTIPGFITALPRILRSTIVNMPPFALRNFIRDAQQRVVVSDVGSGLMESLKKRGPMDVSQLKLFGGDQAGHYLRNRVDYTRAMDSALRDLAKDKGSIIVSPEKLKNGYSNLIQSGEVRGRLAEYAPAFRYAKNVLKYDDYNAGLYAASKARGLLDFAISGSTIRLINQVVPFTNAGIQGLVRSMKAAERDPGAFLTRLGLYIVVPTLIERAYNKINNDKEYRQQPAYIRDMFYNFKIGPDKWLRIPKPFEIGVLASGVGRLVDAADGDARAYEGYGNSVKRSVFPIDDIALAGPYQGIVQAIANYDFFRNRSIVPRHEEKLDLDLRNTAGASRIGKWLQDKIGIDARKIDFLMRQQFGYLGGLIASASNTGRKDQPGVGLRDTGMVVSAPAYAARDVQWVMNTAAARGLSQRYDYKALTAYLNAYWNAPNNEGKDIAAERLTDYATKLRNQWEGSSILENRKLKKKVERKAKAREAGVR